MVDRVRPALASPSDEYLSRTISFNEIYRFAVEQTGMSRGQVLELAIVLILVFELVLFFVGVMP